MSLDRTRGYYEPEIETMGGDEREAFENEILKVALEYAYTRSAAMREKLKGAGIDPTAVKGRRELEKIPLTRKGNLRKIQEKDLPFGGMTGCDMGELRRVYVSPGPIYDPEGRRESHWRWEKVFYAAGFRKGDLVQNTFMYHMSPAGLMFDEALINLGCTVIPAGVGNTDLQVQIMKELPVTGYVGTPSFLMTVLAKAREMGVRVGEEVKLEVALVAGEMLPESLRGTFLDEFGIMVRQCYGTADAGSLGYECFIARGMHVPDEIILEIVDPETGSQLPDGETGEVVVTLRSSTYPLVRFATGDLSYLVHEQCECGRTSKKLGGILGRVDQVTKVKGVFIHPSQVEKLKDRFKEIDTIQVLVDREGHEDRMTICAVLKEGEGPSEELLGKIEAEGRELLKVRGASKVIRENEVLEEGKKIVDRRKWD